MSIIELDYSIDSGHRIVGHKGQCAYLHGHTYTYSVRVLTATLEPPGFVIDFGDIKAVLKEWDHRFLVWNEDPLLDYLADAYAPWLRDSLVVLPFNPTSENLSLEVARRVFEELSATQQVDAFVHVTCSETPKSRAMARWPEGDNLFPPLAK